METGEESLLPFLVETKARPFCWAEERTYSEVIHIIYIYIFILCLPCSVIVSQTAAINGQWLLLDFCFSHRQSDIKKRKHVLDQHFFNLGCGN